MKRMKTAPGISLVCIYLGCFFMILLRWIHIFDSGVVVISQEITSHISNFALSLMGCLLVGNLLLSFDKGRSAVIALCLLVAAANSVYEAFLPLLNTPDLIDAVYRVVAALISMLYLIWLECFGFQAQEV